jgi:hypothetical protein
VSFLLHAHMKLWAIMTQRNMTIKYCSKHDNFVLFIVIYSAGVLHHTRNLMASADEFFDALHIFILHFQLFMQRSIHWNEINFISFYVRMMEGYDYILHVSNMFVLNVE